VLAETADFVLIPIHRYKPPVTSPDTMLLSFMRRDDVLSSPSGATIITPSRGRATPVGSGLSTSDKIAIAVGVPSAVAAIAATFLAWYLYRLKKRKLSQQKGLPERQRLPELSADNGGLELLGSSHGNHL
jgi:hypothetical protein